MTQKFWGWGFNISRGLTPIGRIPSVGGFPPGGGFIGGFGGGFPSVEGFPSVGGFSVSVVPLLDIVRCSNIQRAIFVECSRESRYCCLGALGIRIFQKLIYFFLVF